MKTNVLNDNLEKFILISKSQSEARERLMVALLHSKKFIVTKLKLSRQHLMDEYIVNYLYNLYKFKSPEKLVWYYPFKLEIDRTIYANNNKFNLIFDEVLYSNTSYPFPRMNMWSIGFSFFRVNYRKNIDNFACNFFNKIHSFKFKNRKYKKLLGKISTNDINKFNKIFDFALIKKIESHFTKKDKQNISILIENGYIYVIVNYVWNQKDNIYSFLRESDWNYNYSMSKTYFHNRADLLNRILDATILIAESLEASK
ncbi:hypothetical protein EI74_0799 [Mycoplasma testudineum]|uniref:Uncharacterized protein n=1 Tax=Mycoplasma testudineum TaxID=244584 RepID=A0A4R6IBN3_9MOLU|nr:hypothetical protein [Mycoplasma testudineum]OYD26493.1 hypothetical protein CG473_03565 [Mycoplasma testudineum]TDO18981.1 hypothetical protein EI74_0799 [Mycoplasma testudineum]